MAALANLPPTLRRKIALAQKYAYCPAALPYLEPITYPWVIVPLGNAQRRVRREIADRIDAVNFIREYIQDGHWPPPGLPGEWGPQPVDPQDFPGPYFEPAEWVLAPEDPTKRSRRWDLEEEVEPHGDATEEASNLIHPPKQPESNYESKKARRRSQDNWDRNSISSSLKTEYLPPDWVFKDSLPDSWKQNPNSARAEADDPPVNSVKPRESLGNSQDDRRSEPNSEQPQAESPLETIVCESQEDDSAPLQDAQDTRDTFRILVGDEDVDALTLLTDPSQHQAEGSQHSFHTVSTLPLPPEEQNRLHLRGGEPDPTGNSFCQSGPLVCNDPDHKTTMDEQATQPVPRSTEAWPDYMDLSKADKSDVICVLSPGSPAAYEAVELVASTTPQHILQKEWAIANSKYLKDQVAQRDQQPGQDPKHVDGKGKDKDDKGRPSLDIALRLSSNLLHPWLGFTFGRVSEKCDMLICTNNRPDAQRVSGAHFRIYVTAGGVLMCRDTSTNGTWVEGKPLEKSPGSEGKQISLHEGCTIEVMLVGKQEYIRFFVRNPERDDEVKDLYANRLEQYISYIRMRERQHQEMFRAKAKGMTVGLPMVPILPFESYIQGAEGAVARSSNIAAGTERFNYGMRWNGKRAGKPEYAPVAYIGKGAFASVYKLARRHDGTLFAVKEINNTAYAKKGVTGRKVDQELKIMQRLQHPNIVQYVEHHEHKGHLYIIMEYVKQGDLQKHLGAGKDPVPEAFCQAVASQMCQALQYLHDNGITHRDLKPDNILMESEDPYLFKLSDFGLSKIVTNEETFLDTFCGTLLYCAPEVYPGYERAMKDSKRKRATDRRPGKQDAKRPYTSAVDTWGLAAVLYHLLRGSPPFPGQGHNHHEQMLHTIMTTNVNYERLRLHGVSEQAIDFLERSLVIDPALRLTDDECLHHAWITHKGPGKDYFAAQLYYTQRGPRPPSDECSTRSTERVEEDELIAFASQLNVADPRRDPDESVDEEFPSEELEEIEAMAPPRRNREVQRESQEEEVSLAEYTDDLESSGPPLPSHPVQQQQPGRLFGEVTQSVLQSSGVLDWQARAALGVASQGNRDPTVSESHYEGTSQFPLSYYIDSSNQSVSPHPAPPHDSGGPAPSLFGAEAMVGDMKMDTVMEDAPSPHTTDQAASQKTEETRHQHEAFQAKAPQSTSSSQRLYSTTPPQPQQPIQPTGSMKESKKHASDSIEVSASKRHELATGRSNLHPSVLVAEPSFEEPSTSLTHESKHLESDSVEISNRKRFKLPAARSNAHQSMVSTTAQAEMTTQRPAGSSQKSKKRESKSVEVSTTKRMEPTSEEPGARQSMAAPTARKDGKSGSPTATTSKPDTTVQQGPPSTTQTNPNTPSSSFTTQASSTAPPSTDLPRPPPTIYGTLTTTSKSLPYPTIPLTKRCTSFGRHTENDYYWPHARDSRVALRAFDITFWRQGIDADLAHNPSLNWPAFADISAIVSTRTSRWVFVNGVHLRKGPGDKYLYGHLRSGDVVTVFGPDELVPPEGKKVTEWLEFEVDIKIGKSKETRGKDEVFKVVEDVRKGARASSVASSGKGDEVAVAGAKDPANSFPPPAKPAASTSANKSMRAPGKGK